MSAIYYSLFDVLRNEDIYGLIFDKFGQKHHFRLFADQREWGCFEAFISSSYDGYIYVRHKTKKFENLILTDEDNRVLRFAFLHRNNYGRPDGMGDISDQSFNVDRFSPGTRENNYIYEIGTLLSFYNDSFTPDKVPLPKELLRILSISMSFCYFDKKPLRSEGSICLSCAQELRNHGYVLDDSFIGD